MSVWWGRARRLGLCVLLAMASACAPAAGPSTGPRAAQTFEEYATAACDALQSLWRAYGNPDTAALSPMMRTFEDAVKRGDVVAAGTQAAAVRVEVERGRAAAAVAAGWPPGTESMRQMDRLLVAFEALLEARRAATPLGYTEATDRGQAAFMAAGGVEAWRGMLQGIGLAVKASGKSWPACEGIPIS